MDFTPIGGGAAPAKGGALPNLTPGNNAAPLGSLPPIDPATLQALQAQIGHADPSLLSSAMHALKTPLGIVGGALHVASLPGQFVRQHLLGAPTGSQFLHNHNISQGKGFLPSLVRGVAGFGIDAATDPLTYLTAGTEGIGKGIAQETLLGKGLEALAPQAWKVAKEGGTSAAEFALTHADPAVRDFAKAVTASPSYARNLQSAESIIPGIGKALPEQLQGGLRARIPFSGHDAAQLHIVPASVTSKLSAPVGEAIKNSSAYDTVARNLSTTWKAGKDARAAGDGTVAMYYNNVRKLAANERNGYSDLGKGFAKQIYDTFGRSAEGVARAHAAFNDPASLTSPLTQAEREVVSKWHDTIAPADLAYKQGAGFDVTARQGYVPRQSTPEAMNINSGGSPNPVGQVRMSATPGSVNERPLGALTFKDAQTVESSRLGVPAYIEDPARSIANSMNDTAQKVYAARIQNAMARVNLAKSTLMETANGASLDELKKLGVTPAEARRAYIDGVKEPWMAQLTPETQHALAADANVAQLRSTSKLPANADALSKATAYQSRLATSSLKKQDSMTPHLADLTNKAYRVDEIHTTDIPKLQADIQHHSLQKALAEAHPQNVNNMLAQRLAESDASVNSVKAQLDSMKATMKSPATHQEAVSTAQTYHDLKNHFADVTAQAKEDKAMWRKWATNEKAVANNDAATTGEHIKDLQGQLKSVQSEAAALVREGRTDIKGTVGNKIAGINDGVTTTENRMLQQQARVDSLSMKKSNLEAGLKAGGDEWPVATHEGMVPQGWRTINNASLGIFNGKSMPAYLANEIENALKVEKIPGVLKSVDEYTNFFKRWVTVPFPHFWLKRAEGARFVNMLGGVPAHTDIEGLQLFRELHSATPDLTRVIHGQPVSYWKDIVARQGILPHGIGSEVGDYTHQEADNLIHKPGFGVPLVGQASQGVQKVGSAVLGTIDGGARLGAFMHGMDTFGDENAARQFVMQRHGDFSEMTPFEKTVLKRAVPFYKWLRVKTPLVMQSIAENPGRVIMPITAQQNILGDPAKTQAAYANGTMPGSASMKGGFIAGGVLQPLMNMFGAGGQDTAVTTDLPTYSLNGLAHPASELHPLMQLFQGLSTNTQQFPTGAEPLHMTVPAKGVYGVIARGMEHIPGLSQLVARTPGGDIRINSKAQMILGQLPSSQVASLADSIPSLTQGNGMGAVKALSPFSPEVLTPQVQQGQMAAQKTQLQALVSELYRRQEATQFKGAHVSTKAPALPAGFKMPTMPKAPVAKKVALPKVG